MPLEQFWTRVGMVSDGQLTPDPRKKQRTADVIGTGHDLMGPMVGECRYVLSTHIAEYSRLLRLAILLSLIVLGVLPQHTSAQGRPNIILILTDDQGIDAVDGPGWPNDLSVHTPNLRALAGNGRVFSTTRTNPFCSPTRACMLTGRMGLSTGVNGVVSLNVPQKIYVSMQGSERTIAEIVRASGYYTIHIDKWHLGFHTPFGQHPLQQGYEDFVDDREYIDTDDPIEVGDELMSTMVDLAVEKVRNRPDPDQPYLLIFWIRDPHSRNDKSGREPLKWWKVQEDLLPSGERYYNDNPELDTNLSRYRAVVEALDTEIGRLLRSLGVTDSAMRYRQASDTIVLFTADNGTPTEVSPYGERAKGSLYEPGVRVPMVAFGERVPAGRDTTLVSHVDFFDTICDIASIPQADRGNMLRESMSFADCIGWSTTDLPDRRFTISSRGSREATRHLVALADHKWKLICAGGSEGLNSPQSDEFYNLAADPGELNNLLRSGMNETQLEIYFTMRDQVVNYWPSAVCKPLLRHVDVPSIDALTLVSDGRRSVETLGVGHRVDESGPAMEARALLRFDIASLDDLLPPGRSMDDVEFAQIIMTFDRDSVTTDNSETGPIRAFPMIAPWSEESDWDDVADRFAEGISVGKVDLPPFIIPVTEPLLDGVPLPPNGPLSLGQSDSLLEIIRQWHSDPSTDHGVIVIADPIRNLPGDQAVTLKTSSFLRLTLRPR